MHIDQSFHSFEDFQETKELKEVEIHTKTASGL